MVIAFHDPKMPPTLVKAETSTALVMFVIAVLPILPQYPTTPPTFLELSALTVPDTVIFDAVPCIEPHKTPMFSLEPDTVTLAFSKFKLVTAPLKVEKNPTLDDDVSIDIFLIVNPLPIRVPLKPSMGFQLTPDKSMSFFN